MQPETPIELCRLDEYYSTIFTNIEEVRTRYPDSILIPGMINTSFYHYVPKPKTPPIKLIFSAYLGLRKNFPQLIEAFNQLDDSFHLHIIGNWQDYLPLLTNPNYTFHNRLEPEEAANIYQQGHVFISCSKTDWTASDGFPTAAAFDAMSTGCLLVSTNPRKDRYMLTSGIDYLEITKDGQLVDILRWVKDHFNEALAIAANGMSKVKSSYDSKLGAIKKLKTMGLIEEVADPIT